MTNNIFVFTEDEFENEKETSSTMKPENHVQNSNSRPSESYNQDNKRRRKLLVTEKVALQKKMQIEKEIKQERKKRPKNLLFITGYSSEESQSGCDSDKDAA